MLLGSLSKFKGHGRTGRRECLVIDHCISDNWNVTQ